MPACILPVSVVADVDAPDNIKLVGALAFVYLPARLFVRHIVSSVDRSR